MKSSLIQMTAGKLHSGQRTLFLVGCSIVGSLVLAYLVASGQIRLALTIALTIPLLAAATVNIQASILVALGYLVVMGDLRRLLIPVAGWSGHDPLLLVGAAFAFLACVFAWASHSIRLDTPIARWIAVLMAIMVLQVFNPVQGELVVGVAGIMFYIVPLLWYWIGKTYCTSSFVTSVFYRLVVPLAILAAVMGYYQSFFGYLPYQKEWYDLAGAARLGLGSSEIAAPMSFFYSQTEYGHFLIVAIVLLWAYMLRSKQRLVLLPILFLFVAVFLTGTRGPIVKVLFTGTVMWALLGASKATWIARGAIAAVIVVLGIAGSLGRLGEIEANERIQHRVARQSEFLLDPMSESSTAANHSGRMLRGFVRAFKEPLGSGLGATTKGAVKFGAQSASTEVDISDVFLSTGIVGGAIYVIVICLALITALRFWIRTRGALALGIIGTLVVVFLSWTKGYAVAPLVWFCIGALDHLAHPEPTSSGTSDSRAVPRQTSPVVRSSRR